MSTVNRKNSKTPAELVPSQTPVFDALIMEAQRTPREDMIGTDELARQLGITDEERAAARASVAQWAQDEPDEEEGQVERQRNGAAADERLPSDGMSRQAVSG